MSAPRIVMLDDSKTVLLTSKEALTTAGYEVLAVTNPEQLDTKSLNGTSLILIDVNMPEVFGDDVVQVLRDQYAITVPIYLYSTIGRDEGNARALAAGASGFIRKRDPQTLVKEVQEILATAREDENDDTWKNALGGQLQIALMEHAERVDVLAGAVREMDSRVLRKTLALEMHGAGGEAALMGYPRMRELTSEVINRLLDPMVFVPDACWGQLASWFRAVCLDTAKLASGTGATQDPGELEIEQRELVRALIHTNTTTFRPSAPQVMDEEVAITGRRLLVIDDSAVVRTLLASTLGDLGYPVATARDLAEASLRLVEFSPELVITDVSLPGVEGDEICRRIKSGSHRLLPVVFFSGLSKPELQRRAREAGADGFVNKEEGYDALARCVAEMFRNVVLY